MNKKIFICSNKTDLSLTAFTQLKTKLTIAGFTIIEEFDNEVDLLISIGGDGATINALHKYNFPSVPIIGVNTGTLGFFQEINPEQLDEFIENYIENKYRLQPMSTVKATIETETGTFTCKGLNEIVIGGCNPNIVHLNISIDNTFIEKFSGDGIIIATPAGSTAYSYSLGGAIVDPRLKLLQITPVAPMNTTAYRSFTSSLLLPPNLPIYIRPERNRNKFISVTADGFEKEFCNAKEIKVEFAKEVVNLLRFESYEFWNKVKSKFL